MKEINYSQSMTRKVLIKGNIFTFLKNFKPILENCNNTNSICYLSHIDNSIENMLTWDNFIEKCQTKLKYGLNAENKYNNTKEFIKFFILGFPANRNLNNYTRIGSIDEMVITSSNENIEVIKKELKKYSVTDKKHKIYDPIVRKIDNNKYNIFYCYWPCYITNIKNTDRIDKKIDSTNVVIRFIINDEDYFKSKMTISYKNYIYTDHSIKLEIDIEKYKGIVEEIERRYFIKIIKKIMFHDQVILVSKDTGLFIDKLDENYPSLEYNLYGDNKFSLGPIDLNFDRSIFHTVKINDGLTGENALLNLIQKDKGEYTIECLKTDKGNRWCGYKL